MNAFLEALAGHTFLQNALIGGMLASVACGVMGTYVVVKRIGFLAGGIAHAVLGGSAGIVVLTHRLPVSSLVRKFSGHLKLSRGDSKSVVEGCQGKTGAWQKVIAEIGTTFAAARVEARKSRNPGDTSSSPGFRFAPSGLPLGQVLQQCGKAGCIVG